MHDRCIGLSNYWFQELGTDLGSFISLIMANNYTTRSNFLNMSVSFQGSAFLLTNLSLGCYPAQVWTLNLAKNLFRSFVPVGYQ
jgi:hypothetical protein